MPASARAIIESARAEVVGLELEGLAIGLHRLFELAGVEPVPLALRAAVDLQIGTQKRRLQPGWCGTAGIRGSTALRDAAPTPASARAPWACG